MNDIDLTLKYATHLAFDLCKTKETECKINEICNNSVEWIPPQLRPIKFEDED